RFKIRHLLKKGVDPNATDAKAAAASRKPRAAGYRLALPCLAGGATDSEGATSQSVPPPAMRTASVIFGRPSHSIDQPRSRDSFPDVQCDSCSQQAHRAPREARHAAHQIPRLTPGLTSLSVAIRGVAQPTCPQAKTEA